MTDSIADRIIETRHELIKNLPTIARTSEAAEGGCGVLGFASTVPVAGRHVLTASAQMHNRGNGKGGGIAMAGLDAAQMRVDADTLRTHYLLQIAFMDAEARPEVEATFIQPHFEVAQAYEIDHAADYQAIDGLEVRPPDVWRYFVRVKPAVLEQFAQASGLTGLASRAAEDEFVYQNSFRLNQQFYASLGEKRAFVLSHGRDLIVLKIVGYAEQVVEYYQLHDQVARVWIAHQRYPTKGRVWHPGGAHPFVGLNEALVHNGDFANYHAVSEYLRQRNIVPLFLTDTEVSALLFDLWDRVYQYPLEVTLEAMAPTTEHDFAMLPPDKQTLYRAIQATHIHASPDGPWFFIVARSRPDDGRAELLGITDTSMLRPQVFALYENSGKGQVAGGRWQVAGHGESVQNPMAGGPVQIGLIASERQAINACLRSLAAEDERFQPLADQYWVARGGSHTDGGAFHFSVSAENGLVCANKFAEPVRVAGGRQHVRRSALAPEQTPAAFQQEWQEYAYHASDDGGAPTFWRWLAPQMPRLNWHELAWGLDWLRHFSRQGPVEWGFGWQAHNWLRDRVVDTGAKKRASVLGLVDESLVKLFDDVPLLKTSDASENVGRLDRRPAYRLIWQTRHRLHDQAAPTNGRQTPILILDTLGFPPEGDECAANWIVLAHQQGWRHIVAYNWRGGRFAGSGLGPNSRGLRLDLYGDVGDYAASGLDGAELHLHSDGQDQLAQILQSGKLVIHGDVGQTFLYGAKGGEVYVRGSAAGRPLINAVGKPRAVINGTCLDYLAESFMAGDPLKGGGFVIVNGLTFGEDGRSQELPTPYPGGNLFSLASGGAIYLRDPHRRVSPDQLNGGAFAPLSPADWQLIEPYLQENERLFGIAIEELLTVEGKRHPPAEIYCKVQTIQRSVLNETENR